MFGLFAKKCPLDTWYKTWIERRMVWLADRFGLDRMRNATVILPTPEFFPDSYSPDEAGFRHTLRRVCGYMGVDPDSVRFVLADDEELPNAAGVYYQRERSVIVIARRQLADPSSLVATLAHELAHEHLLKGGHLTADTADHEMVTDLLPVFLGLGVFGANATLRTKSWSDGQMSYFQASRQGYLSSLQLGYALAVFCHVRGEHRPKWVKHLRPDAGVTLKAGLAYLTKTADTLFDPDADSLGRGTPSAHQLKHQLAHASPTVRLNALWDVPDLPPPELLTEVEQCVRHRDGAVRREAVRVLGGYGPAAAGSVPTLIEILLNDEDIAGNEAAHALGNIGTDAEAVVPALVSVLTDRTTVTPAAAALVRFGPAVASSEPKLLTALEAAGNRSDDTAAANLIAALLAADPDAAGRVKAHFAEADKEERRVVLGELIRQTRR